MLAELQAGPQSLAPHLLLQIVLEDDGTKIIEQGPADGRGTCDQTVLLEPVERGEAVGITELGAFGAGELDVVADCFQPAHKLGIEILLVKCVFFRLPIIRNLRDVNRQQRIGP